MSRLTIDKRRVIIDQESSKKYHDLLENAKNELRKEITKEINKTVPDWITEEMTSSGYVRLSCSIARLGEYNSDNEVFRVINRLSIEDAIPCITHHHTLNVTDEIKRLANNLIKLQKDWREFREKLSSVLNGFTTQKRLIESVPELSIYFSGASKSFLPVPVAKINEIREMLKC